MIKSICVVPIEFRDGKLLEALIFYLSHTFDIPVKLKNKSIDIERTFDERRNQFQSSLILEQLIDAPLNQGTCKIIGVCQFDLFIPIFTYVFGEAQLDGIGAVVSTHRLRNEFYGGVPHPDLLKERLIKETIHELGHTFGLAHCNNSSCVMTFSTYVEDIDEKSALFCNACSKHVKRKIHS